jgi:A/G-specific adenine glycosylase
LTLKTSQKPQAFNIDIHFKVEAYQEALAKWYDDCGRKTLPWQMRNSDACLDPYRVWISEIMLQQTQVATVIPYYERFMLRFPTVFDLAEASQDALMLYWAGLGYYARARNLHKAAVDIVERFYGIFPDSYDDIMALSGIGRSTAGAILSIAFQQPRPILDGNVKRVFARLFAIQRHPSEREVENNLWTVAQMLMPKTGTQTYTQSIMDLGATICTRSKPNCSLCPLIGLCLANKKGIQSSLPIRKTKSIKPKRTTTFLLYENDQDEYFFIRNPNSGIWGGLYSLPEKNYFNAIKDGVICEDIKHVFTHFELRFDVLRYKIEDVDKKDNRGIWINRNNLRELALPAPLAKVLLKPAFS